MFVKTHQLTIVQTERKNMLNHHTIFYCELFAWLSFRPSAKSSTGLMSAGARALRHWVAKTLNFSTNEILVSS